MIELIIVVIALLGISFVCSLLEAVILSMTSPYIQSLVERRSRAGMALRRLKEKIDEPISAILTLNTISHTVGAAVAGAMALQLFGSRWMAAFSAVLTLLILVLSEIIPKTLGAHYWKGLGPVAAYVLEGMIFILKPLIIPVKLLSRLVSRENPSAEVSKGDIYNYIKLGYYQGVVKSHEFEIIENLFHLSSVRVKDIMTPRTVVHWLPVSGEVRDIAETAAAIPFSRLPLYNAETNVVEGVVLRRALMEHIAKKRTRRRLKSLAMPPLFVIETISVYRLLNMLVKNRSHLAVVLNEFGDYTGIVTIEDAIETLLGMEIVDESDTDVDMRELARNKRPGGPRSKIRRKTHDQ